MLKAIRSWRISVALPFGVHVWYDPMTERVVLMEKELTTIVQHEIIGNTNYASVSGRASGGENDFPENPDKDQGVQLPLPLTSLGG